METQEVKVQVPVHNYESRYVLVPRTVQEQKVVKEKAIRYVDKQVWETKMVAIQVLCHRLLGIFDYYL